MTVTPTVPKAGDRVKVTYDAIYQYPVYAGHVVRIGDVDKETFEVDVPKNATIEVLKPPVQAGDEVTGDAALALPVGSVVLYEPGGGASMKIDDVSWAAAPAGVGRDVIYRPTWGSATPFRVLHVGLGLE